jgi:hypothetical protein
MARKVALAALLGGALWASAGASSAYALNAAPTDLNFGAVQTVGTKSAAQSVLLHACPITSGCTGSAPSGAIYEGFTSECPNASLAFASSCKTSNQFDVVFNDCPASLSPGQPCSMNVRFTPTSKGSHYATLYTGTDSYQSPCCSLVTGDKVFMYGIAEKATKKKCSKKKKKKARKKCKRKHKKKNKK